MRVHRLLIVDLLIELRMILLELEPCLLELLAPRMQLLLLHV